MSEFVTKDSGSRAEFANGGVRDSEAGKARFDLVCPVNVPYQAQMLTRWAELMGRGAEKYADRNWEQFSDKAALDRAKSSAFRHFMQWLNGEVDEDHAAAVFFNVMAAEYVSGVLKGQWQPVGQVEESSSLSGLVCNCNKPIDEYSPDCDWHMARALQRHYYVVSSDEFCRLCWNRPNNSVHLAGRP